MVLCNAIRARRLVRFVYDGYERVVEPHAYGVTRDGRELLTGWLVGGWSASALEAGWRSYHVDEMHDTAATATDFPGPRAGYNPRDPRLVHVYCHLEPDQTAPAESP